MTLLGAGVTFALVRGGERDEATGPGSASAGRASVSDNGETVDVTVGLLEADNITHVVLRDADRNELVVFNLYREGEFNLESVSSDPVRFDVRRSSSRSVRLYAGPIGCPYELTFNASPNGPSEFSVKDASKQSLRTVCADTAGRVTRDEEERHLSVGN
jgi:hypothetical protein